MHERQAMDGSTFYDYVCNLFICFALTNNVFFHNGFHAPVRDCNCEEGREDTTSKIRSKNVHKWQLPREKYRGQRTAVQVLIN